MFALQLMHNVLWQYTLTWNVYGWLCESALSSARVKADATFLCRYGCSDGSINDWNSRLWTFFFIQFRQQKTRAQQYMSPSSITSETQWLWCVKRMKALILNDRAVKNSGYWVDGISVCCRRRRHQSWTGGKTHFKDPLTMFTCTCCRKAGY